MAAKLTPQLTNTQVKCVGTRFASRRSAVRKKRSGVNRECHARRRVETTDQSDPGRRYQDGLHVGVLDGKVAIVRGRSDASGRASRGAWRRWAANGATANSGIEEHESRAM